MKNLSHGRKTTGEHQTPPSKKAGRAVEKDDGSTDHSVTANQDGSRNAKNNSAVRGNTKAGRSIE